ncbi:BAR adaptor protein Hob1 [Coemansia spiralis]|nr:BAR adaptor protein Hob1 [Coemansia spiralis]
MSWKGFKKALERMPHQLQSKIGRGSKTVDPEFDEVKERFVQMERVTKELFQQTAQFRDGVRGLLVYQGAYLEQVLAIYRPISTDPEGVAQPVGSYTDEGASPELLRVAEDFRNRIATIRQSTDERLGRLDASVVAPIQELMVLMRNIHKAIQKRDHKMLDYDRFRAAVEKAEAKEASEGQRRLPDERAFQKHGAQYQEAARQYNYYNDMLKDQLRQLLDLRQAFIDPIFLKFFRLQEELYTSIFQGFTDAARSCPALDLTTPVLAGWQPKWARAENSLHAIDLWGTGQMTIVPHETEDANRSMFDSVKGTFRKKDKQPAPASASSTFTGSPGMASGSPASSTHGSLGYSATTRPPAALYTNSAPAVDAKPPPSYTSPAPPLPPPVAAARPRPPVSYVKALYDFSGEANDLTFRAGDTIELVQRTPDKDDWWTGRLNGRVGTFPGTYVEEM